MKRAYSEMSSAELSFRSSQRRRLSNRWLTIGVGWTIIELLTFAPFLLPSVGWVGWLIIVGGPLACFGIAWHYHSESSLDAAMAELGDRERGFRPDAR